MLARIEKAVYAGKSFEVIGETTAITTLLAGLVDYAGLYPPAALDMGTAVGNYLRYRRSTHASALGRFVVSLDRLEDLRNAAGDSLAEMKLSVILSADADFNELSHRLGNDLAYPAFECKVSQPSEIERLAAQVPATAECYFEIPMGLGSEELLDEIAAQGARVKLRMGGVVAEAFPPAKTVALMLRSLAQRRLAFKATAGLHHPVRSRHAYTYEPGSPRGMMHGFLNLAFATTLLHFGGSPGEALHTLEEEDTSAWEVERDAIHWGEFRWSTCQLEEMREQFLISFGSCSFEEPIRDLEAMGWL